MDSVVQTIEIAGASGHAAFPEQQLPNLRLWHGRSVNFVLSNQSDFEHINQQAVGDCQHIDSVETLFAKVTQNTWGCVIIDCDYIDTSLVEFTSRLWSKMLAFPVIAIANRTNGELIQTLVEAGVTRFVAKPLREGELAKVIARACRDDNVGEPSPREIRRRLNLLTAREREVLTLCLDGSPAKVIAKQLGVTFQTIDKHRARALRKLSAGSLLELVQVLSSSSKHSLLKCL